MACRDWPRFDNSCKPVSLNIVQDLGTLQSQAGPKDLRVAHVEPQEPTQYDLHTSRKQVLSFVPGPHNQVRAQSPEDAGFGQDQQTEANSPPV